MGRRLTAWIGGLIASLAGVAALAQNLDEGKSPAQLYAASCAECHRNPRDLTRAASSMNLESFLRQHYTISREDAAAMARYVLSMPNAPGPAAQPRPPAPVRGQSPAVEPAPRARQAKTDAKSGSAKGVANRRNAEAVPTHGKPGAPEEAAPPPPPPPPAIPPPQLYEE